MTMWVQGAFQQDANGLTPAEIARRRAVAEVLMGGFGRAQNVGEGAADLMTGIALGIQNRRNNAAEKSGREGAAKLFSSLFAPPQSGAPAGASFNDVIGATGGNAPAAKGSIEGVKKALLDTIAGPESAGRYDVMYGGGRFKDFADHPRRAMPIKSGPNAGKTSSAAGRYQFLGKTWDHYRDKLGLQDFSPASQDAAAWALASDVYKGKTGRDLESALASGDPNTIAGVGKSLSGTWTSLPGGIEQGIGANRFVTAYQNALGAPAAAQAINKAMPTQVASLDPSAGLPSQAMPPPVIPQANQMPAKPVQMAQGAFPPAPSGGQQGMGGPSFQALMEAMQNPWLDDAQRQIIGGLLQKQLNPPAPQFEEVGGRLVRVNPDGSVTEAYNPGMSPADQARMDLDRQKFAFDQQQAQANDPIRALEMQKLQQEIAKGGADYMSPTDRARLGLDRDKFALEQQRLQMDQNKPVAIGGALVNPATGQPVYQAPRDPMTINPGQTVFDPATGRPVFTAPQQQQARPMTEAEKAQYGIPKEMAVVMTPDGPKAIGNAQTTVNVNNGGSSEYNKKLDQNLAEKYIAIQDGAQAAQNKMATLGALRDALGQASYTGMGAETLLSMKRAGRALGLDIGENLGPEETANALGNQLALQMRNPSGGAGMPGAMSDKDREFLVASVPGLTKTPQGNAKLIDYMLRVEQRNLDVARMAQQYADQNGQIDNGFFTQLSAWSNANPLFGEAQTASPSAAPVGGNIPEGVTPDLWSIMTPEERALWQK